MEKGAISFQNKLFFGTFLNHTGLDNFFSAHTTEFVKKKKVAQNQSTSRTEKQTKKKLFVIYYLYRT